MLNKVTDYEIVIGKSPDELTDRVKESMDHGWVPSGPLYNDLNRFMQVMVKFGQSH
ncbi:MAG TPA: hypothetical protein VFN51_01500 [Candidatus Saccharimonadales bacterium]|nr:hypothetical protein [Candidatus Saccharimonadales bacterium]